MNIPEELEKLRELKIRKQELEAEADGVAEEFKALQTDILEAMEEQGFDALKVGGVNYSPGSTLYHKMEDRAEFLEWAKENDPELIEPRERKSLLNQLVRQCRDDGVPLPPGLGTYEREYIKQSAR